MAAYFAWGHYAERHSPHISIQIDFSRVADRGRIVLSQSLSHLDGDHLKVVLVGVNYGPGEASPPHSHPALSLVMWPKERSEAE